MIQTLFKAFTNDVDEALKEKPGGGALDDDEDPETNNRSGGALPISGGGEAEALPEAVATVIAKTGTTEDETTKMGTFVYVGARWTRTCRLRRKAQVHVP